MKSLLLGSLLLLAAISLHAQPPAATGITISFAAAESVTLTARQTRALQKELIRVNARSRVDEEPWTLEAWLKHEFEQQIARLVQQSERTERALFCDEDWPAFAVAEQQSIIQRLNGVSPCATP